MMFHHELFEAMDTLDKMFSGTDSSDYRYAVPQFPPTELLKRKDGSVDIRLAVAGYKKEDIEITTDENRIVVSTTDGYEQPVNDKDVVVISQSRIKRSPFKNSFIVPETKFDLTSIKAKYDEGILTITVQPKERKEYKKIEIE